MKTRLQRYSLLLWLIFIGIGFGTSGCYKEKDTIADIMVTDVSGKPASDATVRLYCQQTNCIIDETETTGSDGRARFKFKPNTEYKLFVEAQKGTLLNGANDWIELEQRKVNSLTVVIK